MYRISYVIEIVLDLLKEKTHVREMARNIGASPMQVSRGVKELLKSNVVDFSEQGKNKVYFLKKTAEARSYAIMAENYKLNKLLSKYPSLRGIVEKIQNDRRIKMALFFGSYASFSANEKSDIDIFIETGDRKLRNEMNLYDSRASVKIGSYDKSEPLVKEIDSNHVIIKGSDDYYGKSRFFG